MSGLGISVAEQYCMKEWWKSAVIYQIYPRSFQDANGDGCGDLRGIHARLPYLARLGVDAIWISPVFQSPMRDFGYDISDYCAIDPLFGTMQDFDALLAKAHRLGLRVILDFVPNHTSDQHPWFTESRTSRASAKRDWYLWRDKPNNWLAQFGGSAWEWDVQSEQFYHHAFLPQQPDLNWRNAEVRAAMFEVMRFWFRKGVDGFRVDVIWHLLKDAEFRDNPANETYAAGQPEHWSQVPIYNTDRPEIHDLMREFRQVANEFEDRLLIGEIYLPYEKLMAYYGRELDGLHLPFNFSLIDPGVKWTARTLAKIVEEYEAALPPGGWPNWVLGNHDQVRIASRVSPAPAPLAAMLLLTLRGTPTIYYGDELGMEQGQLEPAQIRDPLVIAGLGRDGARTPMQWDGSRNAGFSVGETWLPVTGDFRTRNVECEWQDEDSMLHLHYRLLQLRRERRTLSLGSYRRLSTADGVLGFVREKDLELVFVALNFSDQEVEVIAPFAGRVAVSTVRAHEGARSLRLAAFEGVVWVPG